MLFHYLEDGDHNKVMHYRVTEAKKAGVQDTHVVHAVQKMELLKEVLSENFTQKFLLDIPEYHVFQRVLEEQTQIDDNGKRIPKDKKDILANSVQNPFDETVTYRYKRGYHHGHVLNVAEVCNDDGSGIIIHAVVEPNTQSDSRMVEEYMEQQPDDGPEQILIVDGAYNSDSLEETAAKKNVKIQTTSLTGKAPKGIAADFILSEEETEILSCPAGKVPTGCKYNAYTGCTTATIPDNCCAPCPHKEECKAKVNNKKNKNAVRITGKTVSRAKQARHFQVEEGKKNACRRNGVEGITSVIRQKYGLDYIPVFGLDRLKNRIWTTFFSHNLVKYQKYQVSLAKPILVS